MNMGIDLGGDLTQSFVSQQLKHGKGRLLQDLIINPNTGSNDTPSTTTENQGSTNDGTAEQKPVVPNIDNSNDNGTP